MDGSAVVIPKKMLALKSLNVVDATSVDKFRDLAEAGADDSIIFSRIQKRGRDQESEHVKSSSES